MPKANTPTRAIWKGTLQFGLVGLGIKVYTAISEQKIPFNQIHSVCNSRISYQKFCKKCDRPVESEEIQKGYEIARNEYVTVTDDELAQFIKSAKTITVLGFYKESLPPIYYKKYYYLAAQNGAEKPLLILTQAMKELGVQAIAKITMRGREHLCSIQYHEGGLALTTLYYDDEVRSTEFLQGFKVNDEISEEELNLAKQLVNAMTKQLNIEEFTDEYREKVSELIAMKSEGKVVDVKEEVTKVTNLIDSMKASIKALEA